MPSERPSRAQIEKWLSERRRTVYGPMHQKMVVDQQWLNLANMEEVEANIFLHEHIPGFREGYRFVRPPLARMGVATGLDTFIVGEVPDVIVIMPATPHYSEKTRKERAEKIQRYLRGWLYRMVSFNDASPIPESGEDCLALGLATVYYPPDSPSWPKYPFMVRGKKREPRNDREREKLREYERKRMFSDPFDTRVIHPLNSFPDPYHSPPEDIIIVEHVRNENAEPSDRATGQEQVERIIYVSPDWYAIYRGGDNVLTEADGADEDGVAKNPVGFAYFRIAWSGLGKQDETGSFEHRGQGILRDGAAIIRMYLAALNVVEVFRLTGAFPQPVFSADDKTEADEVKAQFQTGPGAALSKSNRVSAGYLTPPPVPDVAFKEEEDARLLYEAYFGMGTLRGSPFPQEAASRYIARVRLARTLYQRVGHNLEQMWASIAMDRLYFYKHHLTEPVTSWLREGGTEVPTTLQPEDIDEGIMVYINFAPATSEERAAKLAEGERLLQPDAYGLPKIDRYTFHTEYAGREDALAIEKAIFVEKLIQLLIPTAAEAAGNIFTKRIPGLVAKIEEEAVKSGKLPRINQEATEEAAPPTPQNGEAGMGGMGPPPPGLSEPGLGLPNEAGFSIPRRAGGLG